MLKSLFWFFDSAPWAYWALAAPPTFVLLAQAMRDAWSATPNERAMPSKICRQDWLFLLLVFILVFAWRWPFLLNASEYDADESQLISGAATLWRDPVFWRSVDAATAGPIDLYILLPLHALGLPLDFFGARLTGLLLGCGMLVACYLSFRELLPPKIARLALLPSALFMAVLTEGGFIHHATESAPLLLIAFSSWLLVRGRRRQANGEPSLAAFVGSALLSGFLPWAKLQAAPFAAALVMIALVCAALPPPVEASRFRNVSGVVVAAALPSILAVLALVATGEIETMWRSYILQNLVYAENGEPWSALLHDLGSQFIDAPNLRIFSAVALLTVSSAAAVAMRCRRMPGFSFWLGASLTVIGVVTVLSPHRAFPHYFLFLFPPLMLWTGAAVAEIWSDLRSSRRFHAVLATFVIVGGFGLVTARATQPPPFMIGILLENWRHPRSAVSSAVLAYAKPGDTLAIWGWAPTIYVETQLPQAVRDGHVQRQVEASAQQSYFLRRYRADLERSQPPLFVDLVGPGCGPLEDRSRFAHEVFPDVGAFVLAHYRMVEAIEYARIYVRNDIANERTSAHRHSGS